jgi:hypothetical protein
LSGDPWSSSHLSHLSPAQPSRSERELIGGQHVGILETIVEP